MRKLTLRCCANSFFLIHPSGTFAVVVAVVVVVAVGRFVVCIDRDERHIDVTLLLLLKELLCAIVVARGQRGWTCQRCHGRCRRTNRVNEVMVLLLLLLLLLVLNNLLVMVR